MEQKKRKKGMIIGGIIAAVVVIALLVCWLMGLFGGISSVKAGRSPETMQGLAMHSIPSQWTRLSMTAV